jgi:hypothetical protein
MPCDTRGYSNSTMTTRVYSDVRARGADGHLGIDKGLAGVCPAISVVTAT